MGLPITVASYNSDFLNNLNKSIYNRINNNNALKFSYCTDLCCIVLYKQPRFEDGATYQNILISDAFVGFLF
ncbi:MAG: hypothetical protein CVT92_12045 [Bacteroidetes bacterium HGW-Bacteroidetes-1]|nr:MAG: hypothetical protein CVT92_12045 [Bacteroidetes bacterium HGW-Bacteroidetes-1]